MGADERAPDSSRVRQSVPRSYGKTAAGDGNAVDAPAPAGNERAQASGAPGQPTPEPEETPEDDNHGVRRRDPPRLERDGDRKTSAARPAAIQFQGASDAERLEALSTKPAATGTKWDGLVAAMAEHLARLHGHKPPEWVEDPERFNNPPINYMTLFTADALTCSPAAFLRHGALSDPAELDARVRERDT